MTRFAAAAARAAGFAGAVLGWSPDRFWRATPAELAVVAAAMRGSDAGGMTPPDAEVIAALRKVSPDG